MRAEVLFPPSAKIFLMSKGREGKKEAEKITPLTEGDIVVQR